MAREEGGAAALARRRARRRRRRKREAGGAGWAKKAEWAGWLLDWLGRKLKKILSE
jgi:hypothetical protein